jgi:PD-(D/E)XK endonuclease
VSERYDFIVDTGRQLWRVQLKSTGGKVGTGYTIRALHAVYGKTAQLYTADEIDVLVAHIIPEKCWYVVPVQDFLPCSSLRFYPDTTSMYARWEKYHEAWELLRTRHPGHDDATAAALEAAYRSECKEGDWRRCLLHIADEILREKRRLAAENKAAVPSETNGPARDCTREIPRPAGESAGLRNDVTEVGDSATRL